MMWLEWVEAMLMMLPMPCSIMCGNTGAGSPYQAPSRSMAKQRRQSSSVICNGSRKHIDPGAVDQHIDAAEALDGQI